VIILRGGIPGGRLESSSTSGVAIRRGRGKYDGKNWWFGKDEGIVFKRKAPGLQ
jgi:hypothetical protein